MSNLNILANSIGVPKKIISGAIQEESGAGSQGITEAEAQALIDTNNTNYVDVADATLQTGIDTLTTQLNDELDLKADKADTYTKTEVDSSQSAQDTLIQANTDAIATLNAPASTPNSMRAIATDITVNSTNFGKLYYNSGSISIPTTKTNLDIGTFSGSFYNSSGTVLTITKAGLVSVRFYATLDGSNIQRNVELAIEISTDDGTTWAYAPNSLRLWEQSTINSDRNAFFSDPVAVNTKFRLAYASSGTGTSFIQPIAGVLTGSNGYTWLIELEWRQL